MCYSCLKKRNKEINWKTNQRLKIFTNEVTWTLKTRWSTLYIMIKKSVVGWRNVENPWFHVDGGDWPTATSSQLCRLQIESAGNRVAITDLPVSVAVWARCAVRSWWCWTSCQSPCWTRNWTAPARDSPDIVVAAAVSPARQSPRRSRSDTGVWRAAQSRQSRCRSLPQLLFFRRSPL